MTAANQSSAPPHHRRPEAARRTRCSRAREGEGRHLITDRIILLVVEALLWLGKST
jgi:hypothetical protein